MKTNKLTNQVSKLVKKYLKEVNFNHLVGHQIVGPNGIKYEWREQKNGLIKYKFDYDVGDVRYMPTVSAIIDDIEKKELIIINETKHSITAMKTPDSYLSCV